MKKQTKGIALSVIPRGMTPLPKGEARTLQSHSWLPLWGSWHEYAGEGQFSVTATYPAFSMH